MIYMITFNLAYLQSDLELNEYIFYGWVGGSVG